MTDGLRWHATGLSTMATCPEKFRRAYVEREDHDRMSAGSIIGRALHHAAQLGVEALMEGQQPERQFLLENAAAHFDGLVLQDAQGPDPIPWDDDPGSLSDRQADLRHLVELWYARSFELFRRWGKPTMAENHFSVELWGHTVTGQIDAATERDVVIDWKSGIKPLTSVRAEREMQKLVYPAAYERLVGRYPGLLVFVQVWRKPPTKTRPNWTYHLNIQEQLVDPGQKLLLRRLLDDNQRQVDAGVYPLNISSGLCSPDWCPFWPTCDAHLIKPLTERDAPATTETVEETADG
jgi:hypothetical protein